MDQEDDGAAERPGAAGCWEEPGWSWSHVQGTSVLCSSSQVAPPPGLLTWLNSAPSLSVCRSRCCCLSLRTSRAAKGSFLLSVKT